MSKYHSEEPKRYAAVIRWKGATPPNDISVEEYFRTQQEAEVWIASQEHDPTRYEWEVMKYV